ncbi:hypothetical protein G7Y89_g3573 [Cudoniella acicularis]|uniref:Luciferase-like domain-containing protein n=1 Tax=Cudoniella acicularis TaxID=354080 RepID=A0A8H4RSZ0_9HELO|nr:hypothetical protein G7Y89_g3573 [Cudoniella acicularis]
MGIPADDQFSDFNNVHHRTKLAKLLEAAKPHGIFIADVLGGYNVYQGPRNLSAAIKYGVQWPFNEPLAIVPAMAAATESLGFRVMAATTYEQPYHLARYLDSAARNLGATKQPKHDERYAIAEEYLRIMYKLWQESWRDDAMVLNRETGVPGPYIRQPSPQRTRLLFQAGTSKAGKAFASQYAEAIFVAGHSPAIVAKNIAEIQQQAQEKFGRDPKAIKFLALICPIIGKMEEEAAAKFAGLQNYGDINGALALFWGWTGIDLDQYDEDQGLRHVESNTIRSAVEDESESDVDGFNIAYALKPGTFVDIIELLLPELRKNGLFWNDYLVKGGACRENVTGHVGQKYPADDHPAARYHWRVGVEKADHVIPPEPEQESKHSLKRQLDISPETGRPKRRESARVP